jgi:S1-C subfamily serine protease
LFGLASLSDQAVRDGEGIAVSGYPLAEPALVTTSGAIASAFGSDIQEIQAAGGPAGFLVPDSADSYLADVAVNPGNSGGPVYRIADGSVLGVCVAFRIAAGTLENHPSPFFYNSGLSVVVPIKYGQSLIARHASTAAAD